jgi:H+/gluconate symporter-like permease
MKMKRVFLFLFALVLLLSFSATIAQDVTDEPLVTNTPAVTEAPTVEPTPVVEPEPEPVFNTPQFITSILNLLSLGIGVFTVGTFSLAALLLFFSRRDVQDQLEKAYESASPDTQDRIREGYERGDEILHSAMELLTKLSEIVDKVTDGKPNDAQG